MTMTKSKKPTLWTCPCCRKDISRTCKAISCTLCRLWIHPSQECSGIEDINALSVESIASFKCPLCQSQSAPVGPVTPSVEPALPAHVPSADPSSSQTKPSITDINHCIATSSKDIHEDDDLLTTKICIRNQSSGSKRSSKNKGKAKVNKNTVKKRRKNVQHQLLRDALLEFDDDGNYNGPVDFVVLPPVNQAGDTDEENFDDDRLISRTNDLSEIPEIAGNVEVQFGTLDDDDSDQEDLIPDKTSASTVLKQKL